MTTSKHAIEANLVIQHDRTARTQRPGKHHAQFLKHRHNPNNILDHTGKLPTIKHFLSPPIMCVSHMYYLQGPRASKSKAREATGGHTQKETPTNLKEKNRQQHENNRKRQEARPDPRQNRGKDTMNGVRERAEPLRWLQRAGRLSDSP